MFPVWAALLSILIVFSFTSLHQIFYTNPYPSLDAAQDQINAAENNNSLTANNAPEEKQQIGREVLAEVAGQVNFKIKIEQEGIRVRGENLGKYKLVSEENKIKLKDQEGDTVYRFKINEDGQWRFYKNDIYTYKAVYEPPNLEIKKADGSFVSRLKIKGDKFNLYDANQNRIAHGKADTYGYKVKDESENRILKIKGDMTLSEAGTLSLQFEEPYRVLMWSALRMGLVPKF